MTTDTPDLGTSVADALDALDQATNLDDPVARLKALHADVWPEIERTSTELRRLGRQALVLAAAELWHTGVSYRAVAQMLGVADATVQGWVTEGRNLPEFVERHGEPSDARAQARGIKGTPRVGGKLAPRATS